MNLFDRFQRVAKANLNNVLKSLEDPEKIMTQALEDMQVSLCAQDYLYLYWIRNVLMITNSFLFVEPLYFIS
jgi:hypothetical protein